MQAIDFIMIAAGYLSGSIPFGQIIFYLMRRDDVRKYGSKSIGATNVVRNAGLLPGVMTFLLDILKGTVPIFACGWVGIENTSWTVAIVAVAAVIGHMFPVWLGFKGGKGVATGVGVFIALSWQLTLIGLVFFVTGFALTRIVSVGSLLGTLGFVVLCFTLGASWGMPFTLQIAAVIVGALIFIRHCGNIARLVRGEEKKLFSSKKKETEGEAE